MIERLSAKALENYQIQRQLASGGMAEVYLATDKRLGRMVALKVMTKAKGQVKEAQLLAQLNHLNIVQIFDLIETDELLVLVMEYIDGQTLTQVSKFQALSLVEKLTFLLQIARGLNLAHENGIIHGDLKASNIMIGADQQVKLIDFGIASHHDQLNPQKYGSFVAMSPEQFQGKSLDHRSDLFAFGVLAYQLIVGQHPFGIDGNNQSLQQARQQLLNTPVIALDLIEPNLPSELVRLVAQLLELRPHKRPQSCHQVVRRLEYLVVNLSQQQGLEQDTVAIDEQSRWQLFTVFQPFYFISRLARLWYLFPLGFLVYLLLWYGDWELFNKAPRQHHIAVLPVSFSSQSDMSQSHRAQFRATINDALEQYVVLQPALYLVDHSEWADIDLSLADRNKRIATVTGATDVITTDVNCNGRYCEVVFARIGGENWRVLKRRHWPIVVESYSGLHRQSTVNFAGLFDQKALGSGHYQGLVQAPKNAQDHQLYLQLYRQIRFAGRSEPETLQKLSAIIHHDRYFYGAYRLYREVALDLYHQSGEAQYTEKLQQVMNLAPRDYRSSVLGQIDLFWLYVSLKQYERAQNALDTAIQSNLDPSSTVEYQGLLAQFKGEHAQAIEYFEQALKLRSSATTWFNMAISHWWQGSLEQTAVASQQVLNRLSGHYKANQLLASVSLLQGELDQAISAYLTLNELNPSSANQSDLSVAYSLNGQLLKALDAAREAVAQNPNNSTYLLNLADLLVLNDSKEQAMVHYRKILAIHQQNKGLKAHLESAQAFAHTNQSILAVKALNLATSENPVNSETAFVASLVYTIIGEHISALTQVEQALTQGMGAVWFNLPWFDPLCEKDAFVILMAQNGNDKRCPVI